jgi:poly-gamma-glutamate system protein
VRLLAVAGLALGALGLVAVLESGPPRPAPDRDAKLAAARLAATAAAAIREGKLARGIPIPEEDRNRTGLVGPGVSPLVSSVGHLTAKRTAANPNFAAVLVELFHAAGLRRGDVIAAGFSGSFPSLNVATLAAAHVLGLRPVVIASVGSSNYGATDPAMTWLDMERVLAERGVWPYRSVRAGFGGIGEIPALFADDPRELARAAMRRNGVAFIEEGRGPAAVARRLAAYRDAAGGAAIRAFVNVGGAAVNLGEGPVAARLPAGLAFLSALDVHPARGVVARMAEQGRPVIHLLNVERLARRFGLPLDPAPLPVPGDGGVFAARGRPA